MLFIILPEMASPAGRPSRLLLLLLLLYFTTTTTTTLFYYYYYYYYYYFTTTTTTTNKHNDNIDINTPTTATTTTTTIILLLLLGNSHLGALWTILFLQKSCSRLRPKSCSLPHYVNTWSSTCHNTPRKLHWFNTLCEHLVSYMSQ